MGCHVGVETSSRLGDGLNLFVEELLMPKVIETASDATAAHDLDEVCALTDFIAHSQTALSHAVAQSTNAGFVASATLKCRILVRKEWSLITMTTCLRERVSSDEKARSWDQPLLDGFLERAICTTAVAGRSETSP
jgi:hypothetical protein